MIDELNAAITGLNDKEFQGCSLWFRLVDELISAFKLDENAEAVVFWKRRYSRQLSSGKR